MSKTLKLMLGSVLVAFGVLLPVVFHLAGALGPVFLPMHIPVLIAGLMLGPYYGLCVGVITPVVSALSTGMPPLIPVLPVMVSELSVYGITGGYLYQGRRRGIWLSLIAAMAAGRLTAAIAACGLAELFAVKVDPLAYITGAVLAGLPGIALQFTLVPLLVRRLEALFQNKLPI